VLADESRRVRAALSRLLEDEGFVVVSEVDDGLAAVAEACRNRPDVVLVDVRLPRLDGLSAAAQILRSAPETRVVICTAVAGVEDQARKLGAFAVVPKGSNPALLVGTIRRALAHADATATATRASGPGPAGEDPMRRPA
jgi:CheY-like chemotaxis protein